MKNTHTDERGFAMFDVLLGMMIFALISVIAVQSVSLFQEKADLKAVAVDAQSIASGIESYLTENEEFPLPAISTSLEPGVTYAGHRDAYPYTVSSSSQTDARGLGVKLTPGHRLHRYWVDPEADTEYQFCVVHTNGAWVAWTSNDDRIFAHSTSPATGTWNKTSNPCAP